MKTKSKLQPLVIAKGTTIHLAGLPFLLSSDAKVFGTSGNMQLANDAMHAQAENPWSEHFVAKSKQL